MSVIGVHFLDTVSLMREVLLENVMKCDTCLSHLDIMQGLIVYFHNYFHNSIFIIPVLNELD